jgi:hypothetical protein
MSQLGCCLIFCPAWFPPVKVMSHPLTARGDRVVHCLGRSSVLA